MSRSAPSDDIGRRYMVRMAANLALRCMDGAGERNLESDHARLHGRRIFSGALSHGPRDAVARPESARVRTPGIIRMDPACAAHQRPRTTILGSNAMARRGLGGELWAFMRVRKKWWLLPILVVMVLVGVLLVFAQTSVLAPFIYTIF